MRRRSSSGREAALHVAFRLLTIRARSQQELARHLRRRGFAPAVVAGVLEDLRSRRLLDDRAFAAERARTAVLVRRVGARRLRAELRASGVASDIVEVVIRDLFGEIAEEDVAVAAATRRLKSLGRLSLPVARRRLAAYLQRRGFASETIHRVVTALVVVTPPARDDTHR